MDRDMDRPWWQRPLPLVAAAAVLVAIALVVGLSLGRGSDDKPKASAPTAPMAPAGTPTTAAGYESSCGLTGGDTAVPTTTAPKMDRWERLAPAWATPHSKEFGPGVEGDVRRCFARAPMGAVIAGITDAYQVDGMSNDFQTAVATSTMPGPGQRQMLARGKATDVSADQAQVRGFKVDSYTDDQATISYYLVGRGMGMTCSFIVQWSGGDWRLQLTDNGQTPQACTAGAPSNYVPWGA